MDIDDMLAHGRDLAEQIDKMEGSEPNFSALALDLVAAFKALDDHMTSGDNHPPEQWR